MRSRDTGKRSPFPFDPEKVPHSGAYRDANRYWEMEFGRYFSDIEE